MAILKILSAQQTQVLDQQTILREPISSIDLMERASRAFFSAFQQKFGAVDQKIYVLCGPGNNGGDGLAVARMLHEAAYKVEVWRVEIGKPSPDHQVNLDRLKAIPAVTVRNFSADDTLYVSPGVPLATDSLQQAQANGSRLIGDVQLFGELSDSPRIAVTGTNGKSTLVDLVTQLFVDQGKDAVMAGNIGTPCLDVLDETATTAELGKPAGSDAQASKSTYPSLLGLAQSRELAQELLEEALPMLDRAGVRNELLTELGRLAVHRAH